MKRAAVLLILVACKGEAGEQGPAGAVGKQGPAGADGIPGKDGTDGTDGTNGTDGQDGAPGAGVVWTDANGDVVPFIGLGSWQADDGSIWGVTLLGELLTQQAPSSRFELPDCMGVEYIHFPSSGGWLVNQIFEWPEGTFRAPNDGSSPAPTPFAYQSARVLGNPSCINTSGSTSASGIFTTDTTVYPAPAQPVFVPLLKATTVP